jgi:nicotinamide mononucleotide adenylyltransferase
MEKINIVLGRFQPFTNGHLKCCEKVYKDTGVPSVLCVIDTVKTDNKHPFLTKILWGSFQKLVKSYKSIAGIVLVRSANIIDIKERLEKKEYEAVSWSCGTDRYDAFSMMCSKYAPEIKVIEIKRDDNDISATAIRNALLKGDKDFYIDNVPSELANMYDKLRNIMLNL